MFVAFESIISIIIMIHHHVSFKRLLNPIIGVKGSGIEISDSHQARYHGFVFPQRFGEYQQLTQPKHHEIKV